MFLRKLNCDRIVEKVGKAENKRGKGCRILIHTCMTGAVDCNVVTSLYLLMEHDLFCGGNKSVLRAGYDKGGTADLAYSVCIIAFAYS